MDEWKKKLEDLSKAHKDIMGDITGMFDGEDTEDEESGAGSAGSGKKKRYKATVPFVGPGYASKTVKGFKSEEAARQAAEEWVEKACYAVSGSTSNAVQQWAEELKKKVVVKAYAQGGLSYDTGMAWLDGTRQKPERILSPYQTELFEDMIRSLHEIRTLRVPSATVIPQIPEGQQPSYTIENITVQVQKLEADADYEEIAEKVGEQIMEKAMRGMSVGGLRIG